MAHIEKRMTIHAPVERVYRLARDPRSWETWWSNLSEADSVKGSGEAGTRVEHFYRMLGIPFHVTTLVQEDHADPHEARWKGKIEGPLAGEQTWTYRATNDGADTEVEVEIDYAIPGKVLGKVADRVLVERLEERAIEHTLDNLRVMCERPTP